ncbi:MAG TPA: hydroxyectoine utilization dehydratase EutB [Trueperaceae bacterium]|nr:hydroxyectoine utilization dehydratase EutB [Trueperaceae bacterium]
MEPETAASPAPDGAPSLRDVYRARRAVAGVVRRTPLVESRALSRIAGGPVHLKLENLQVTGAFKARGAANALAALDAAARRRGVIAVSTGNHGRAVATAAGRLGVNAVVCVSERVPEDKLAALRATGCELLVGGDSQDEAEARARELMAERGLTLVHPFDDARVIAGQGTIGLEILEELPDVDTVIVPLSGGGLIAGVALALKSAERAIRVVGVSMQAGAAMARSLQAGRPVPTPEEPTLADSLQGGIGERNRFTFAMVRRLVDEVVLVDEAAIAQAMRFAFEEEKQVLEGAAAVGIAALLQSRVAVGPGSSAVVCSGGNIATERFLRVVADAVPFRREEED